MKRLGNTWNKICNIQNITRATDMVISLKRPRVRKYLILQREKIIQKVYTLLINRTYDLSEYKEMTLYEPKKRIIHYPKRIETSIIHKCLLNIVGKYLISKFPNNSYASIKGRGLTSAMEKIKHFTKLHKNWYYFLSDISKYFNNIDHEILKQLLKRVFKCTLTLQLWYDIIDSYPKGVPIGNHPSSYLANLYLSNIGHKILEELKLPFAVIYMDDLITIFPNKSEAFAFKQWYEKELKHLKLSIKNNWRIAPISTGINTLGYVFYGTHVKLRKRIKCHMKKSAKKWINSSPEIFKIKMASYFGWCSHANCINLLKKTFKDKLMLFPRFSELKSSYFGLSPNKRVSITLLYNKDIIFLEISFVTIQGYLKLCIKFAYPEDPEQTYYTLTRSAVLMDRLLKDSKLFPFIAQLKKDKYTYYE